MKFAKIANVAYFLLMIALARIGIHATDNFDGLDSRNHVSKAATHFATGTLHAGKATVHSIIAVNEIARNLDNIRIIIIY